MKVHVKSVPKTMKVRIVEEPNSFANGGHVFQDGTDEENPLVIDEQKNKDYVIPVGPMSTYDNPYYRPGYKFINWINDKIVNPTKQAAIDRAQRRAERRAERQAEREALANDPNAWMYPTKQEQFFDALNMAGPFAGALSSLSPLDYEYPNDLSALSGRVKPFTIPNIVYEGKYEPTDVNSGLNAIAAQTMATQQAGIQGSNRAANAAYRMATQNAGLAALSDFLAKNGELNYNRRKAIADQALATAQANVGIDEKNAAALIDANKEQLSMLAAAAKAREDSRTARAKSIGDTWTNMFTESGKMKEQDFYNRMYQHYLDAHTLKNMSDAAMQKEESTNTENTNEQNTEPIVSQQLLPWMLPVWDGKYSTPQLRNALFKIWENQNTPNV